MKYFEEITREDDIKNLLSQYTKSESLIGKIIGFINHEFSKGPEMRSANEYAVTLLRKRESISIRVELYSKNGTRLAKRFEVGYQTLKDAK